MSTQSAADSVQRAAPSRSLEVLGGSSKAAGDVRAVFLDPGAHLVLRSAPAAPYVRSLSLLTSVIVAAVEPHAQVAVRVEQVAAGQVHGRGSLLRGVPYELDELELE